MSENNVKEIKQFLELNDFSFISKEETEQAKEMCVAKLCEVLGIEYAYNYKGVMFQIFSSVMAEAIYQKLKINKQIASDSLRLIKYNGINFIEKAKMFLESKDIEEATLDIFNFVDENKKLLLSN